MITHVKRNSQRIGFTKPSHIECAVQFRSPVINCRAINNHNLFFRKRESDLEAINCYIDRVARMYRNLFGGYR